MDAFNVKFQGPTEDVDTSVAELIVNRENARREAIGQELLDTASPKKIERSYLIVLEDELLAKHLAYAKLVEQEEAANDFVPLWKKANKAKRRAVKDLLKA